MFLRRKKLNLNISKKHSRSSASAASKLLQALANGLGNTPFSIESVYLSPECFELS